MQRVLLVLLMLLATTCARAQAIPLDITLQDPSGTQQSLASYFGARPVLLIPVYFRCPNICIASVAHVLDTIASAHITLGTDLDVVVMSFDPSEGPADARAFLDQQRAQNPTAVNIHVLAPTGIDMSPVLSALGFQAEADGAQFAHRAAAIMLTPTGEVRAWLGALSVDPTDLVTALAAAHTSRRATLQEFILQCNQSLRSHGARSGAIQQVLEISVLITLLGMLAAFVWLRRRHNGRRAP